MKQKLKYTFYISLLILGIGFLIPQNLKMPVENATSNDYNKDTFWYYPWGKSGTHKGIDVFAKKGTNLFSATNGIVLFQGEIEMGGNVILVLGPKWRLHYYAHLDEIKTSSFAFVSKNKIIGTVGNSGNAQRKPPHLHYSIATIIPYPWRIDNSPQGYKKMFFLNPLDYL